jgi:hypothetical protein
VFTLETITIGEELESRFFKVLGTVSSLATQALQWLYLGLLRRGPGLDRDLCNNVDRYCGRHYTTGYHWKNILCAMSWYRFVSKKAEGTKDHY